MGKRFFGTDGIRGRVGEYPITVDFVMKLGWAAGQVFKQTGGRCHILVGKDTRVSGYMFESALQAGIIAAGGDGEVRIGAALFGQSLGLCFQAVDDVLDVTGDAGTLGKTPGKDARHERDSSVALLGLDGARAAAQRFAAEAHATAEGLGLAPEHRARRLVDRLLERQT